MIAILLVGLVACANAAPGWRDRRHSPFDSSFDDHFEQAFKTFDQRMEKKLSFISDASTQGIVGNEYKITIPLESFEAEDIVVNAGKNMLNIVAYKPGNYYSRTIQLSEFVGEQGTWSFENGALKISLPINTVTARP
ncbi:jg14948 [Pararge aegeria aegeria]|uniref:Jg14948 protein n=1 Tax=Pararge aegeria aegeria TaxID=348720 RepID=A0A8S4SFF9_9NEOP|nr:jg14948 [Pararge aegeria aegeria]